MKYSANGVDSYDSQSRCFPYVDILNLTVEKIPYNIEAASKLRSWVQIITPGPLLLLYNYGIGLSSFFSSCRIKALAMHI